MQLVQWQSIARGLAARVEPLFDGSEARIPDTEDDAEEKEMRTKRKE